MVNIKITWSNNDNSDAGDISVERSSGGGESWNTVASGISPTQSEYTDTGRDTDQEYQYRVIRDTGDATSTSESAFIIVPSDAQSNPVVEVTWSNNDNSDVGDISVERSSDSGNSFTSVATGLSTNATSYTDSSVEAGETYHYRVRRDTGDTSSLSDTVSVSVVETITTLVHSTTSGEYHVPVYSLESLSENWLRVRTTYGEIGCLRPVSPTGSSLRSRVPSNGNVVGVESEEV